MRRIDELRQEYPSAGSRMLRDLLVQDGARVGRRHVRTLMFRMGIDAIYRTPNTSRRDGKAGVLPYLLRGLTIIGPNQVWAADITYIPMRRGFVCLFAVVEWATRWVLNWRLTNSLGTNLCIGAITEVTARYDRPEIFNADQGCQFTYHSFIERLWRSIKYEEVYLHARKSVS